MFKDTRRVIQEKVGFAHKRTHTHGTHQVVPMEKPQHTVEIWLDSLIGKAKRLTQTSLSDERISVLGQ